MEENLEIRLDPVPGGWLGWSDKFPGCEGRGPDRDTAFRRTKDAIEQAQENKRQETFSETISSDDVIRSVRKHYYSLWRKTAEGIAEEVPERLSAYVCHWRTLRRSLHKVLGVRNLKRALDCCGPDAERTLYAVLGELSNPEDVRGYTHATHREAATYWAIDEHINEVERLLRSLEIVPTDIEFVEEDVSPYVLLTQIRLIMRRRAGAFVSSRRPIQIRKIGTRGPAATPAGARKGYLVCRLDELLPRDYRERQALIAALMCAVGIPTSRQDVRSILIDRKRKD